MSTVCFDVVIPAHNAERWLVAAVESAFAAGARHVVVVDDGSATDQSAVLRPSDVLAARRSCWRVFPQANAGVAAARNRGIDEVLAWGGATPWAAREHREAEPAQSTQWVVFLDADDELTAGIGSALRDATAAGAGACVGARTEHGAGPEIDRPVPAEWADRPLPRPGDVFRPIQLFAMPGAAVRRSVVEAGLRFDPALTIPEDRDFLRSAAECGPVWVSSARVVRYRKHADGGNLSSARRVDQHAVSYVRMARKWLARSADGGGEEHLREACVWLAGQLAKHGRSVEAWTVLTQLMREREWPLPMKARLRRWVRRVMRVASGGGPRGDGSNRVGDAPPEAVAGLEGVAEGRELATGDTLDPRGGAGRQAFAPASDA